MERHHRGTACLQACNLEVMLSAIRWLSLNGIFIEHNTKKQRENQNERNVGDTRKKKWFLMFCFFFQASANAAATPCVPTTCWLIPRRHHSRSVGSLSCQQTIKQRIIYQAPLKVNKQIPRWVAGVWERSDGVTSGSLQKQWSLRFPDRTPADATSVWQSSEHSRAAGSSTETEPTGLLRSTASQNFHVRKARDAVPSYVESDEKKEKLTKMKDYASFPPPVQHRPSFEPTGTTAAHLHFSANKCFLMDPVI